MGVLLLLSALLSLGPSPASSQSPRIFTVTPSAGPSGSTVMLTGQNFVPVPGDNVVRFGAALAAVQSATDSSLLVTIPAGTTYAPISVTVRGRTAFTSAPFRLTFPSNGLFTQGSFAPRIDYSSVSDGPYRVALGDMDGDGRNDIVAANYQGSSFAVLRNMVQGDSLTEFSFSADLDLATPLLPVSLALADLDGDGRLDVVLGTQFSSSVAIFFNRSDPGITRFNGPALVTLETGFKSVACADLDGDGLVDIAVANREANTLTVLRNVGGGGFEVGATRVTAPGPSALAAGDLDGDGLPELVVAEGISGTVTVHRNLGASGTINLEPVQSLACPGAPTAVSVGDLDGDGALDLAVACATGNGISLFRNRGGLAFSSRSDIAAVDSPTNVLVGDFSGDGVPDLAVTSATASAIALFRNAGTALDPPRWFAASSLALGLALGDVTGDGKPDVAVGSFTANVVSVLRNASLPPPVLTVTDSVLRFPDRAVGDSAMLVLTLGDDSPSPLTVTGIALSGPDFMQHGSIPFIIPGHGSSTLEILYRPTTYGVHADTLRIQSDGGSVAVVLSGASPAPQAVIAPARLGFGGVPQYFRAVGVLRITNPSVNPLRIDSLRTGLPVFTVAPGMGVVTRLDTLVVTVTFAPTLASPYADTLRVSSNASTVPLRVPLAGEGKPVTPMSVARGWALLSYARAPSDGRIASVFPLGVAQAYAFDVPTQRYVAVTSMTPGSGFWLLADRDTVVNLAGTVVDSIVLPVSQPGWVLLGSVTAEKGNDHVTTIPALSLASPLYQYNPASGRYEYAATVVPGRGYWALAGRACTITIK